jgi:TadE-like protein
MRPRLPDTRRRGSVLIEFALVALLLTLLLAVIIEFGIAVHRAQLIQQAADVAARELARVPLSATMTFDEALNDPGVKARVYDDTLLVVTLPQGQSVFDFFSGPSVPVVNQLLAPLMIVDQDNVARYPGAILDNGRYKVPLVLDGGNQPVLVPVVEEVRADAADPSTGPFSLTASGTLKGYVALRINFPFQAATLVAYQQTPGDGDTVINTPIEAPPLGMDETPGPYAGSDRLGALLAHGGKTVRPFRRLLSAQAIYRRELFTP